MASSLLVQYPSDGTRLYEKWVNPQWVRLLDVLQMKVRYSRCIGTELHTEDGRQILDFNSGYCVHNAGHNHPRIKTAIINELERDGAAMLQTGVPELAGVLGAQLCERAGGKLTKAFFASSGSEGVEAAIKFSRAHTGRVAMLSAKGRAVSMASHAGRCRSCPMRSGRMGSVRCFRASRWSALAHSTNSRLGLRRNALQLSSWSRYRSRPECEFLTVNI